MLAPDAGRDRRVLGVPVREVPVDKVLIERLLERRDPRVGLPEGPADPDGGALLGLSCVTVERLSRATSRPIVYTAVHIRRDRS